MSLNEVSGFISDNKKVLEENIYCPLIGVMNVGDFSSTETKGFVPVYTKFHDIDNNDYLKLRLLSAEGVFEEELTFVCEKLLRYTEIRYNDLMKRSQKTGLNKAQILTRFTVLSALFLDRAIKNNDLRLLNVCLKLKDKSWFNLSLIKDPDLALLFKRNDLIINDLLNQDYAK